MDLPVALAHYKTVETNALTNPCYNITNCNYSKQEHKYGISNAFALEPKSEIYRAATATERTQTRK